MIIVYFLFVCVAIAFEWPSYVQQDEITSLGYGYVTTTLGHEEV
jgi:hypothetical protein